MLGLWTGLRGARFRSPLLLRVAVPAAFPSSSPGTCTTWVARPRAPPPRPPPGSLRFHHRKGFSLDVAGPEVVGPVRLPAGERLLSFLWSQKSGLEAGLIKIYPSVSARAVESIPSLPRCLAPLFWSLPTPVWLHMFWSNLRKSKLRKCIMAQNRKQSSRSDQSV